MMTRRRFLVGAAGSCLVLSARGRGEAREDPGPPGPPPAPRAPSVVHLLASADRAEAVRRLCALAALRPGGAPVLVKANYNSDDAPPGTTHPASLEALFAALRDGGATRVLLAERSGMGKTGRILASRGVVAIAARHGVAVANLDEAAAADWVPEQGAHWSAGFRFARQAKESPTVVTLSCLKTHRFGGLFTLSLKNAVGLVKGSNMTELHTSLRSQRKMIAEVNAVYRPAWNIIDASECFVDGGPDKGTLKRPGLLLASHDRVALDAVGLAILKSLGTVAKIQERPIFAQDQIQRAGELGLGARGPSEVELRGADPASEAAAAPLRAILAKG